MKHNQYHPALKAAAFILTVLLGISALFGLVGSIILAEEGYFADPGRGYTQSTMFRSSESAYGRLAFQAYFHTEVEPNADYALDYHERRLDTAQTNYRYSIFAENGAYLGGNAGVTSQAEARKRGVENVNIVGDAGPYFVIGMLDPAMSVNDSFAAEKRLFDGVIDARYTILILSCVFLLAMICLMVYLCCVAGKRTDDPVPACRGLDRMPSDLFLALGFGIVALLLYGAYALIGALSGDDMRYIALALSVLVFIACAAVLLSMLLSVCTRIKTRSLFSNTIVWRLLKLVWRFVRWICRGVGAFFANLPVLWKAILAFGGFLLANLILILLSNSSAFALLLLLAFDAGAFALVMKETLTLGKLQADAKALAEGDLTREIVKPRRMSLFAALAASLSSIRAGVSRAVAEQVKSERMRTDLITNVSHDIKTPLTSIVNYVDLLKKETLAEPVAGYVDALDRASQRLKKLTLDVIEASKATSGALTVSLAPADLNEIVRQSAAEYDEKLRAASLALVSTLPDPAPLVLCDGRLLWRALDNLLSNAARYALKGTRVYLDVSIDAENAFVTVKNVSASPLNVSPEELTERFVRGDAARSDGGSGLGLSIAKSLVELQHGTLTLSIDGDLFKACVSIPLLAGGASAQA